MRRWLTSCSLLVCACVEEQRYAVEGELVSLHLGDAPAFVTDDDDPVFVASRSFTLPITPPSQQQLTALTAAANGKNLPFPRLPWVQRDDLELQLDYALQNLGDAPVLATVFIDGRNEFNQYTPGPEDLHQWERRYEIAPRQRVTFTVTELELDEVAIDLATVVNGAPNSNQVVQFQSQSGRDERSAAYVPSVIPQLVGVRVGVEAFAAAELELKLSIRVQDHGQRVAKRGERRWDLPAPAAFVPVTPEQP